MEEVLKDKRFAHIAKDPKFRRIPKSERKVKIDKRFRSMFEDKKFTVKYTIDKRGRPLNQTSTENLKKYYDLSSSEDEDDKKPRKEESSSSRMKQKSKSQKKIADKLSKSEKDNDDDSEINSDKDSKASHPDAEADENIEVTELEENEKQLFSKDTNDKNKITKNIKQKLRDLTVDYARGEGVLLTDSSSDEESTENEDDEEEEIEHNWGELDKEAGSTDEVTHRLAICNMDWDRIRAVDLLVLFNSFLPPGGLIKSITIYPSDFGLQRMKEEEIKGPIELVDSDKREKEEESDEENEDGSEYHMEKMRQYQLNRLKYYYAVMDCDSAETANKIYTECDGIEYESTSTKLDLRFIPDDMEFEHEPKEVCEKLPDLCKYQPRQFTTTALQQVKVELTWDETNPERQEVAQKINSGKLDEINENDMQAYLASGTSDDESDDETTNQEEQNAEIDAATNKNSIDKYKLLLKSIEDEEESKKKQEVELEFTWGLGTKERAEKLVKEKMNKADELTPFEKYLEKRREKKRAKRDERKKQEEKDGGGNSSSDDSVPSDIDMNDPYFADEMKNTKSKDKTKKKKTNNRSEINSSDKEDEDRRKAELELLMLDKEEDEGKRHFNIKKIEEESTLSKSKKKRFNKKNKKINEKEVIQDEFQVDVTDPRFTALYTSHHYNLDPADPHYRKTKGTEAFVVEKLKRRADENITEASPRKQTKKDGHMSSDLAALVKTIKRNTKNISKPIK